MAQQQVRVLWDDAAGWIAEVPYAIIPAHLQLLGRRALPIQEQRLFGFAGDERRVQEARVQQLREGKIAQRVRGREMNDRGDIDLIPPVAPKSVIYTFPGYQPGGRPILTPKG